jgi:hypothetical protein
MVKSNLFKGMEFVFDYADTSSVTGKTYLPIFINESLSIVYGDNLINKRKEVVGHKNSGFSSNQTLIALVKEISIPILTSTMSSQILTKFCSPYWGRQESTAVCA